MSEATNNGPRKVVINTGELGRQFGDQRATTFLNRAEDPTPQQVQEASAMLASITTSRDGAQPPIYALESTMMGNPDFLGIFTRKYTTANERLGKFITTDEGKTTLAAHAASEAQEAFIVQQREKNYLKDYKELAKGQYIDSTGVRNKKYYDERLADVTDEIIGAGRTVSIIRVDFDNMKSYNTAYGHQKTDEILVQIADVLQELTRETDIVVRAGGDEFVIVLPDTPSAYAVQVAQRMLRTMHRFIPGLPNIPEKDIQGKPYGTMSIGVTANENGTFNFRQLDKEADDTAYEVKEAGRNNVALAKRLRPQEEAQQK